MTTLASSSEAVAASVESTWKRSGEFLSRQIALGDKSFVSSVAAADTGDELGDWWLSYLRGSTPEVASTRREPVRSVELFCGPGGLAQGFGRACTELGLRHRALAAADSDPDALAVYEANHRPELASTDSVSTLVDYSLRRRRGETAFRYHPEMTSVDWRELEGDADVLLAGPPCQGHSNLNNHSRRIDERNELYLTVPATAIALDIPLVIIENVPAVVHDRLGVVAATTELLENAGYCVETGVLKADQMGWAQRRSRFFLVASRLGPPIPLATVQAGLTSPARPIGWAIDELVGQPRDDHMARVADASEENVARIAYLFENDLYNLPNSERPDCHKDGTTYNSVYGRLYPDRPAPTITTGFLTPGRGRYIHPTERRCINPGEAARLQGFPDDYKFQVGSSPPSSAKISKWLGDAVPMPLGFAAGLSALSTMLR